MGLWIFRFLQKSAGFTYGTNSGFPELCYKGGCDGDLATGCRWFFDKVGMGSGVWVLGADGGAAPRQRAVFLCFPIGRGESNRCLRTAVGVNRT